MNNTIAFLNFLGGVDIFYLAAICIIGTQILKIAFGGSRFLTKRVIRLTPIIIGAFAAWTLVEYSARGAMIGISIGGVCSISWFAIAMRLQYGSWKEAGPHISERMLSLK